MMKSLDEKLLEMQRASKERHRKIVQDITPALIVENVQPEQPVNKITVEKAVEILKEAGIEFVKAKEYLPKKAKVPKEPKPERKVARPTKEHLVKSMFDTPQKPSVDFNKLSKYAGPAIFNPNQRRPPAVYDNKKSLYGIDYNDL